jgi:lysophospholipase L1-like esterase
LPEISGNINEYTCNKCSAYEDQLKEALVELGSAQMIIDILQKVLLSSVRTTNTQDNNIPSKEGFVNFNPSRKKKKSPTCENGNLLIPQQFKPIPAITNRYALLDNLEETTKMSHSHSHKETSEVIPIRNKNKKKSLPTIKKKKTVIIGDSHARGLATEISSSLDNNFEVTGTVIPGARLENIIKLADGEISALGKSDAVIVMGGANDINKNETIIGLAHLRKFVEDRKNTNIMVVPAPHRYDLLGSSCVNREIVVFNRELLRVVKSVGNVKIVQTNLNRDDFTRHGLHLNLSGKEKVATLIGESIKQLIPRKKAPPIVSIRREELINHHQKKAVDNPTNDDNKETKPEPTVSPMKHGETQAQIRKPLPTTSTDHNNVLPRTSNRTKKIPVTVHEDFLWLTGPLTRVYQQPVQ